MISFMCGPRFLSFDVNLMSGIGMWTNSTLHRKQIHDKRNLVSLLLIVTLGIIAKCFDERLWLISI